MGSHVHFLRSGWECRQKNGAEEGEGVVMAIAMLKWEKIVLKILNKKIEFIGGCLIFLGGHHRQL